MSQKFNPETFEGNVSELSDKELTDLRRYWANAREYQETDPDSGGAVRKLASRLQREKIEEMRRDLGGKE